MSKKSSSANSALSPSPFSAVPSPVPIAPAPPHGINKYSMEEVWKNICLSTTSTASLRHPTIPTAATSSRSAAHGSRQGILSQQFLTSSRPLSGPSSIRDRVCRQYSISSHHQNHHRHSCFEVAQRNMLGLQPYSQLGHDDPAAATILSLNSLRPEEYPPSLKAPIMPSNNYHPQDEADVLNSSVTNFEFSIQPKKRVADDKSSSPSGRKNKRMIKNRESAARSRARKQAYTNELEDKVARLMEENARLRRQQEKLCLAANAQFPKKHMLSRTLTAPF